MAPWHDLSADVSSAHARDLAKVCKKLVLTSRHCVQAQQQLKRKAGAEGDSDAPKRQRASRQSRRARKQAGQQDLDMQDADSEVVSWILPLLCRVWVQAGSEHTCTPSRAAPHEQPLLCEAALCAADMRVPALCPLPMQAAPPYACQALSD